MKPESPLTLQENNPKWVKDCKVTPETPERLERELRKTFQDTGIGEAFLKSTPVTQEEAQRPTNGMSPKLKASVQQGNS